MRAGSDRAADGSAPGGSSGRLSPGAPALTLLAGLGDLDTARGPIGPPFMDRRLQVWNWSRPLRHHFSPCAGSCGFGRGIVGSLQQGWWITPTSGPS